MRRSLLLAVVALAACNTGFDPQYRVLDVRLLAISSHAQSSTFGSNSADVQPGDTLGLTALVANPKHRSGLTVDWIACLPQPSDAASPCLDDANLEDPSRLAAGVGTIPGVVSLGSGTTAQVGPDSWKATVSYPVPGSPDVLAALDFLIGSARLNSTVECHLYATLVVVAVASAEGQRSVSYKLVPILPPASMIPASVSDLYLPNNNPIFGTVQLNPSDENQCTGGTPVSPPSFPAGETVMCGSLSASSSIDSFSICEPGKLPTPTTEVMDWQWYATQGEFPDSGSGAGDARGVHVKFRRPAGQFTLWSIVRDGRGGTDWAEYVTSAL
jgi:hypothetical protein